MNVNVCVYILAPTGSVQELIGTSPTTDTASVIWNIPTCGDRNGPLVHYNIDVENLNSTAAGTTNATSVTEKYDLSGLAPYTVYRVSVSFVNSQGAGPSALVLLTTQEAGKCSKILNVFLSGSL